jgi:hypothetical protein
MTAIDMLNFLGWGCAIAGIEHSEAPGKCEEQLEIALVYVVIIGENISDRNLCSRTKVVSDLRFSVIVG